MAKPSIQTADSFSVLGFGSYVKQKISDLVLDYMPVISHVPKFLQFMLGLLYISMMVTAFVILFLIGFREAVNTKFLSPLSGSKASENCELITTPITGDFLSTRSGYFEGSDNFEYSQAAYTTSVRNLRITQNEYESILKSLRVEVERRGNESWNDDLGLNLIKWATLVFTANGQNAQRFTMEGDPAIILNRDHTDGILSNVFGDCNETSISEFDQATGLLKISYVYQDFINNPSCNSTANPILFGYDTLTKPEYFKVEIDTRTLMVSIAISKGFLTFNVLQELEEIRSTIEIDGVLYEVRRYIDPKFPSMRPLFCPDIIGSAISRLCGLELGRIVGFPFFHHVGNNLSFPEKCDCQKLALDELSNPRHNCNLFRFLTGVIFWPLYEYSAATNFFLSVVENNQDLNTLAYNASFLTSAYGRFSPLNSVLDTPEYRAKAFDFCDQPEGGCSILTFTSYDSYHFTWPVTPLQLQITNGACRDTINPDAEGWERFISTPFAPLQESYQVCHIDRTQAGVDQAGIVIGNLELLKPLMIIIILLILLLVQLCSTKAMNKITDYDRHEVLKDFANRLIELKREKIRNSQYTMSVAAGMEKVNEYELSTLRGIVAEMDN